MTNDQIEAWAEAYAKNKCNCHPTLPGSHHESCPAVITICDCLDSYNWYRGVTGDGKIIPGGGEHHPKCVRRVNAEKAEMKANKTNAEVLGKFFSGIKI